MAFDTTDIVLSILKIVVVLAVLLNVTPIMVWVERRGSALIQDRPGPNRVGPFGLIQSMADALKFILKEDVIPNKAHKVLYTIAPMFGLIPALTTIAVIPWGRAFVIPKEVAWSTGLAIGIVIAVAALAAIGVGTWMATKKYQVRKQGGMRFNTAIGFIVAIGLGLGAIAAALIGYTVHAFGTIPIPAAGRVFQPIIANVNIGILLIFALSSMGVYGLATAGWSSNNKYSLLGGIRASAQMISYELAMTLSAIGTLMAAGSLRLVDVVNTQTGYFVIADTVKIPAWNFMPMFFGFVVFFVAGFAETNRLPFDFPEADAELVAGYHTEYSSMKFAMFFMSEYMAMATMSALITTLFLGGWDIPWYDIPGTWWGFLLSVLSFVIKVSIILFIFVWVRWTLPRLKYDSLMHLGWKVFIPLAALNLMIVAILIAVGWI
ncbi:MAG: NADH-quinone oxidoreductase subunit H [Thermoanaerobaculia bacterium]